MSVVIALKFQGDVATFRQALTDHSEEFAKFAAEAQGVGRRHPPPLRASATASCSWWTNGRASSTSRSSSPTRTCRPSSPRPALRRSRRRSPSPRPSAPRTSTEPGHR